MNEAKYKIQQIAEGLLKIGSRMRLAEVAGMVGDPFQFPVDEQGRLMRVGIESDVKKYWRSIKPQLTERIPEDVQPMLDGISAISPLGEEEGAHHIITLNATRAEFIASLTFIEKKAIETMSQAERRRQLWKTVDYIWKVNPGMTVVEVLREHAKREDSARRDGSVPEVGASVGMFGSPLAE